MDLGLSSKVAIVTGAGTGIGFAVAEALAEEGVRVVMVGRREAVLKKASEQIAATGAPEPLIIPADLTEDNGGKLVAAEAIRLAGQVDILVNSAGVSQPVGIGGSEDRWQHAYALRVIATRHLAEELLPAMRERKFGRIINIGGSWEVQPVINTASVMNAARTVYHKSLSHVVAADGVTVNTVGPGIIESEQIGKIFPTDKEREAAIDQLIPAGYFGAARDLAVLVAFLASPVARYITGEVIAVDGGMHRFAF
tara:strand:+ start:11297 stop:12055 length:759 start_codon:yes stop_codon:yes gene_type:complete